MKTVNVIIEQGADGTFDATMEVYPELKFGLLGQGTTVEEAKKDFMNSYEEMKEIYAEEGEDIEELVFNFKTIHPNGNRTDS